MARKIKLINQKSPLKSTWKKSAKSPDYQRAVSNDITQSSKLRKLYAAFVCRLVRCNGKGLASLAVIQISLSSEPRVKVLKKIFFIHKLHN